jgi:hypothetical protein
MSQPAGNCPSCGAPVQFRWSGAAQTVCPFCRSILVRDDLKLENVGIVADLPLDPSPISLWTEGQYRGKAFQVLGRIIYQWDGGSWNEWHLVFSDGSSGWLSDAQLQYAVSFRADGRGLPGMQAISVGGRVNLNNTEYVVSTITRAFYRGVEGELPFAYHPDPSKPEPDTFADLRTPGRAFGTIDYTEDPPLLFLGAWVDFAELQLKNLKQFEGWS